MIEMVPYNWMKTVNAKSKVDKPIPCQAVGHPTEGVETTGGKKVCLNNQHERPATSFIGRDDIVRSVRKLTANNMRLFVGIEHSPLI